MGLSVGTEAYTQLAENLQKLTRSPSAKLDYRTVVLLAVIFSAKAFC